MPLDYTSSRTGSSGPVPSCHPSLTATDWTPYLRQETAKEAALGSTICAFLSPMVLDPLGRFDRAWESLNLPVGRVRELRSAELTGDTNAFEKTLCSFLDSTTGTKLITLDAQTQTRPDISSLYSRAQQCRIKGETHAAIRCYASILNQPSTATSYDQSTLHLELSDALLALGLYHNNYHSSTWPNDTAGESSFPFLVLQLIDYLRGLVAGYAHPLNSRPLFREISERLSAASLRNSIAYAEICCCHMLVTLARLSALMDASFEGLDAALVDSAIHILLKTCSTIKQHDRKTNHATRVTVSSFTAWRCAQALRECLPRCKENIDADDEADAVTLLGSQRIDDQKTPLHAAIHALQRVKKGSAVPIDLLPRLQTSLESLIRANDLRAIDWLLFALQLVSNESLLPLQLHMRRHSWKLHQLMGMGVTGWCLDSFLLHPLSLWYGCQFLEKGLPSRNDGPSKLISSSWRGYQGESSSLQRLRLAFGPLADRVPDESEAAARFCFAWSILFACVGVLPKPTEDPLYPLIFIDHDLFSFCQLLRHVQQVSLRFARDPSNHLPLLLDGFDSPHRVVAGLGSAKPATNPVLRLSQLQDELLGVKQLQALFRDDLPPEVEQSHYVGHRHLIALCYSYIGEVSVDQAVLRFLVNSASSAGPDGGVIPLNAGELEGISQHIRIALHSFEEAVKYSQTLPCKEISRRAQEKLLETRKILAQYSLGSPDSQSTLEQAEAELVDCYKMEKPLREGLIGALRTAKLEFAHNGKLIFTTASDTPQSALYHTAENAAILLQRLGEAWTWAQKAREDQTIALEVPLVGQNRSSEGALSMPSDNTGTTGYEVMFNRGAFAIVQSAAPPPLWLPSAFNQTSTRALEQFCNTLTAEQRSIPAQTQHSPGLASLVTYSIHWDDDSIHVYVVGSGREVQHAECSISFSLLVDRLASFEPERQSRNGDNFSFLGVFDPLVEPLSRLTIPGELLLVCPVGVLYHVPFHALCVNWPNLLLIERNPLAYLPSYATFERCVQRAIAPAHDTSHEIPDSFVAAAVLQNLSGTHGPLTEKRQLNLQRLRESIQDALADINALLGGRSLWDSEVTASRLRTTFAGSHGTLYIGHCFPEQENANISRTSSYLSVHQSEHVGEADLVNGDLPGSLIGLIACCSSKLEGRLAERPAGMTVAALTGGASCVVGTLWSVPVLSAITFCKQFARALREESDRHKDSPINVARAVQEALQETRRYHRHASAWAPFVMHGSPVFRNIFQRTPEV